MVRVLFYFLLLIAVAAYAVSRGGRDERIAAWTCVAASFGSLALLATQTAYYSSLEHGVAVIDFATLLTFMWIALRSHRFWPLWVAGLQLTATTGHVLKFVEPDLLPVVYAASLASWSYVILLIIAIGTWRCAHRDAPSGRVSLS
jgi:hypothetical protein